MQTEKLCFKLAHGEDYRNMTPDIQRIIKEAELKSRMDAALRAKEFKNKETGRDDILKELEALVEQKE